MAPPSPGSSPGAAPLPPLPVLSGAGQSAAPGGAQSAMAQLMTGAAPVKKAVDMITAACQMIVKSGAVPGAEQVCGQIVALASSMVPMAIQQAMGPGQGPSGPPPAQTSGPGVVPGM